MSLVPNPSPHNPFRTPTVTPNPTGASNSSGPTGYIPPFGTSPSQPAFTHPDPFRDYRDDAASRSSSSSPVNDGPPEELPELTPSHTGGTRSPAASSPTPPPPNPIRSVSGFYPPPPGPPPSRPTPAASRSDSGPYGPPPGSPPVLPPRPTPHVDSLGPPSGTPPPLPARITIQPPESSSFEVPPSPPPDIDADGLPPPAYTPSADQRIGETTVEFGPTRPFQRAPAPPPQPSWPPQPVNTLAAPPTPAPLRVPSPESRARTQPSSPQAAPLSDFAREFYAAGAQIPGEDRPQPRFAPPPGEPPASARRASSAGTSRSGAGGSGSGSGNRSGVSNDGRPTTTPTPGHPLLRDGQILVYPEGYSCDRCRNTGYKNNDPSHPCRRCWDRYARKFTSIFAWSPWGASSGDSRSRGWFFQRPLPSFTPPQAAAAAAASSTLSPPGALAHRRSVSQPQQQPPPLQRALSRPVAVPFGMRPPPGAAVVRPGDPRLGGNLCWRCGGRGVTPFLIFDEMTCESCGGVGRTF
ncbi:hypothetical protein BV25DRAFT_1994978 [Artomyces pyxidatus]|uniref:Uncharacterized protein n=1 Tax=Artomyces pyxidatus TaxID=48021 RepID=A0ACB8SNR4_9AGAM|nr:hypothetical protein BV25DRAFT_1994978 [Artomyces pyxidatus]